MTWPVIEAGETSEYGEDLGIDELGELLEEGGFEELGEMEGLGVSQGLKNASGISCRATALTREPRVSWDRFGVVSLISITKVSQVTSHKSQYLCNLKAGEAVNEFSLKMASIYSSSKVKLRRSDVISNLIAM